MKQILCTLAIALLAAPAAAAVVTDDFEGGANMGGWNFIPAGDVIENDGGNPGGWLHSPTLDTFAPICDTGWGVDYFHGDYVANGVTRISGDFQTLAAMNGTAWYPFALLLRDAGGTIANPEDDVYVYWVDENNVWCPQLGEGWTHYDFAIPSDFVGAPGELPTGWMGGSYTSGPDIFPGDRTWQSVLENVEMVEFWWFHPAWVGIFTQWEVGADNIEIELNLTTATASSNLSSIKALY